MTTKTCPKCHNEVSFSDSEWGYKSLPEDCPYCNPKKGKKKEKKRYETSGREAIGKEQRSRKGDVFSGPDRKKRSGRGT